METSPRFSWIYIWSVILFGSVSTSDRYVIHIDPVNFDKALEECTSGGFLTTLSTKQEEADILNRIAAELPSDTETKFNFWVGLRKARNECIVPHLTLKGFKWTVDGSEASEEWQWNTEPQQTCTGIRCVLMSGEIGPSVRRWGLTSGTCRASYPFICKQLGTAQTQHTGGEAHTTPGTRPQPDVEVTDVVTPQPEQPLHSPKPEPIPDRPKPGPVADRESCSNPKIPGARSLSPDPDNPKRMKVECWSGAMHWLTCSGTTQTWEANGTAIENVGICQKCDAGYEKDASGNCVDIDEGGQILVYPTNGPEPQGRDPSLTSPPESSPGPTDDGEVTIQDNSESGILIPVLIAVMALVVLIVVVAAVVKCCLMRRSKKRAMKKAEKMAMKNKDAAGKDSMETANEKEAM